jgi:hypothetical protein
MATNIQLMEENTDFIQGFHISSLLSWKKRLKVI